MQPHEDSFQKTRAAAPAPIALDRIREALSGLQFGTVTVVIQDGVVVQVERTEKFRLRPS